MAAKKATLKLLFVPKNNEDKYITTVEISKLIRNIRTEETEVEVSIYPINAYIIISI
jgi:hypothetical protein